MKVGKCKICGDTTELTVDHIPQKSLYPKSIRSEVPNMNVIEACSDCNNGGSGVDEIFKVIVGLIAKPEWAIELEKSVKRTLSANKKLSRQIDEKTRTEYVTLANKEIRKAEITKLDGEFRDQFLMAVERCAKAFYYMEFGKVLVEDRDISVFHPGAIHPDKNEELQRNLSKSEWKSVNSNTCSYVFVQMDSNDMVFIFKMYDVVEVHYVIQRIVDLHPKLNDLLERLSCES